MIKQGVAEILKEVSEESSQKNQIDILRKKHNKVLEDMLDIYFNPAIHFIIPEGPVPGYKPSPKEMDLQAVLYTNFRRMRIFLNVGPYRDLKQSRREQLFIEFVNSIDPDDAELIIAMKDGIMPYVGVNKKLLIKAYPALAKTWK